MKLPASLWERGTPARPILGLLLAAAILSGCAATGSAPFFATTTQPANLGDLKLAAREYKRSGAYDRDLAAVAAAAEAYVVRRAGEVVRPALVLDIDETSLTNWPEIEANDFGYIANGPCRLPKGPCGARAWERMGRAKAIAPTLALFNAAKARGVSVFFLTSRNETQRAATAANLRAVGYRGWSALIMRSAGLRPSSAADYKAAERAKIAAKGFTIIANVGDQPSDLAGGYAERSFLLPNPFYRIQ
jgi:predicted secreted acid phosphatase